MEEIEAHNDPADDRRGRGLWILIALGLVGFMLVAVVVGVRVLGGPPAAPSLPIADVSSVRLLGAGSVVGFAAEHETHAWLGIPFAKPPEGPLRWRAPEPADGWAETLDALSVGSPCLQLASALGGIEAEDSDGFGGSEDCLYLNVWAPRAEPEDVPTRDARWPVMVWIHGGGNTTGQGGASMYDGAKLAGRENVLVVSFNYRLGPLGWFSHPALRADARDALEASGNFGTLDQIRALEWVEANIAEFGGDPDNVTIFGESAGGTNVLALMLSDAASGLFDRAIAQSGSTDLFARSVAENPRDAVVPGDPHSSAEIVVTLLEEAGLVPDREAARDYAEALPARDLAELLRSRSGREILNAYRDPADPTRLALPRPIRDGVLLPSRDPIEELRSGRFNHVPLIVGSNRDEMKLFFSQQEEHVRRHFGLLYRIRDREDYERRARHHSDLWTVRAVSQPATAIRDSGWDQIFAYRFDWDELPSLLGQDMSVLLGAAHGFELPFLFGTFDLGDPLVSRMLFHEKTRASRERLSEEMMAYWAEFARTGRPGRGGRDELPEWPRWSAEGGPAANVLVLDSETDGGIRIAQTNLSRELVIAAVDAETGLEQAEKCALFFDLFADRPDWDPEEYGRIGRLGCADYRPSVAGDPSL